MKDKTGKIFNSIAVLILILTSSNPVYAVIIGNKNWLQVTDTAGYSYNDFNSIFSQTTGQCDVLSCQLGGLDLGEYIWASNDEVNAMLASVTGLSFPNFNNDGGLRGTMDPIFLLFTPTALGTPPDAASISSEGEYVGGFTRTGNGGNGTTIEITNFYDPAIEDGVAYEQHFDPTRQEAPIGGWLYTTVVPIPPAIYLFLSGLLTLFVCRKKAKGNYPL